MNDALTGEQAIRHLVVASPLGGVALVWHDHRGRPRILWVVLSRPEKSAGQALKEFLPESRPGACAEIARLGKRITAFLAGEAVRFDLDVARLDLCSEFQRRVLRAEHAIPRGKVSTYGLIAAHLGSPSASRAVGHALAANPFPIIVPCHRAIRSDRTLGGYQGGLAMKRRLLALEGVAVSRSGRVETPAFRYAAR